MSSYDTPDTEQVLQEDYSVPGDVTPIPVCIEESVRTEEMPSRIGSLRNILIAAAQPGIVDPVVQLATDNPKRKSITLWSMEALDTEVVFVCVATSREEARAFNGVLIPPGGTIVIPGTFSGPLFARTCLVTDTTGRFDGFTASTDDMILSVATEEWAR